MSTEVEADATPVPTPAAETPEAPAAPAGVSDFSKYAVGQEYEGKAVSAKPFGVFVDITGINVLLPRSTLSYNSYDKLSKLAEAKSQDLFKIEITTVNAENQTLSGKYADAKSGGGNSGSGPNRPDLSILSGVDFAGKTFEVHSTYYIVYST
jgi:hypothetical protein